MHKFREFIKKHYLSLSGILIGAANGFFGGGGGMIAVPVISQKVQEQKKAHATSIGVTVVLSLVSAAIYVFKGGTEISSALPYIPMGLVGAATGGLILKKIPDKLLKKIFAVFMIVSGIKIIAG